MKRIAFTLFFALFSTLAAYVDDAHRKPAEAAEQAGSALSEGEIRKVDKDAKKITIRHGPLKNLDMPAMTMVFQVKEPEMLDQVKAGDKVKFEAQNIGGVLTITRIEAAP